MHYLLYIIILITRYLLPLVLHYCPGEVAGNEKRILVGFEDPYILYNVDGVSPVRIEI